MLEGIILAGGLGSRLKSAIYDVPKPMAPIGKKPFLELVLENLVSEGFSRIILSVGYKKEIISKYFGKQFKGIDLVYSCEESPLGTGGAVRKAMELIISDHVFIFNGDTYLELEIAKVEEIWQKYKLPIIVGKQIENADRYGSLLISGNRAIGFSEKVSAANSLVNVGCYVFRKKQLDFYPLNHAFNLEKDYFERNIKKECFNVYSTKGRFIDIGIPEDYYRAIELLK